MLKHYTIIATEPEADEPAHFHASCYTPEEALKHFEDEIMGGDDEEGVTEYEEGKGQAHYIIDRSSGNMWIVQFDGTLAPMQGKDGVQ